MLRRRFLPCQYAVRNLLRRPARSVLTLAALTTVVLLMFVVVGFVRGLEQSLAASGDPAVVLVYSLGAEESIENSAIEAQVAALLPANVESIQQRYGVPHVSPELYLATRVQTEGDRPHSGLGLVRGVTRQAPLVRRRVQLVAGRWPGAGEVIVGRLAAAKLGCDAAQLDVGRQITFENRTWRVSGRFAAGGSALDSEIWCPLDDFQTALRRQDLSLAAVLLRPGAGPAEVQLFCQTRTDLEIQAVRESEYYAALQAHYRPLRYLAWTVVLLVGGAGVLAGLNMMYAAVAGRVAELAMLQAVGFRRRAILATLVQEGTLLAALAALLAGGAALAVLDEAAVRFTMGAFALRIDAAAVLVGCGTGLFLGVLGALPPALRALRLPVAQGIRAV